MRHPKDKRIELPVPFLKDKTAILLDEGTGWLYPTFYPDYKTIVLDDLVERLTPDLLQYMFPGQERVTARDVAARIREMAGLDDTPGFLYKKNGAIYFRALGEEMPEVIETSCASAFEEGLEFDEKSNRVKNAPKKKKDDGVRFAWNKVTGLFKDSFDSSLGDLYDEMAAEVAAPSPTPPPPPSPFPSGSASEYINVKADEIIAAWEELERRFGVTPADVEILLGYRVKPSRLSISTAGGIFLTDFDNKQVKMDDLTKAVYFYYLKHPEGARLKELQEHESEILGIYMSITGRDDIQGIRNSVHNLLDPYANNLNTCFSRIKRAFKNVVGDRIASFYYVDGSYAEVRTVKLDRDLVLWEH